MPKYVIGLWRAKKAGMAVPFQYQPSKQSKSLIKERIISARFEQRMRMKFLAQLENSNGKEFDPIVSEICCNMGIQHKGVKTI